MVRKSLVSLGVIALVTSSAWAAETTQDSKNVCKPSGNPYKGVYYANDFKYLESGCEISDDFLTSVGDNLKRIKLNDAATLDIGGEFRLRYHNENNHGSSRLDGLDNEFLLSRLRTYANLEVGKHFRAYAEIIDASSGGESLPSRGIEVDRLDLLNGFIDVKVGDFATNATLRVGRQELLFGQQRLISPLDFGNTRRTFDGARLIVNHERWTFNAFAVNTRNVLPSDRNTTNSSQDFLGLSAGYRIPGHEFEVYALKYDEDDSPRGPGDNFDIYTYGARYKGREGNWLFEGEGGFQTGNTNSGAQDLSAEFLALGVGYDLNAAGILPTTAWINYDYASGDEDPNDDQNGTFRQLFPLAHAYLGFVDLIARQNIEAWSFKTNTKLHKNVNLVGQLHKFNLAEARDGLQNAPGAIIRRDITGQSGTDVGWELDFRLIWRIHPRMNINTVFSTFWGGDFVDATNPAGVSGNARFFNVQWTINY